MIQRTSRSIGMGIVALMAIAPACLAGNPVHGSPAGGIGWRSDLTRAHAEARSSNRLLWLQFTGPWCQFCHLMDRQSFVHPRVVGQARDYFVPIKLQSDAYEELISRFNISGLPATVILSPSGELIAKHEGYVDGDAFHTFLEAARSRFQARRPSTAASPTRSPSPAREAPAQAEVGVALAGYCPVSLVQDHRLVLGKDAVSLQHEGRVYRFANPGVRGAFERQPERFIPVNGGRCPVSQVDRGETRSGDPRFGILYQGHLYLCGDDSSRIQFLRNPERYSHVDLADRKLCPHCWGHDYVLTKNQVPWSWARSPFQTALTGRKSLEVSGARDETVRR